MSDLLGAMAISASGMQAQSERTRVIAENVANSDNTPEGPGQAPFTRKTVTFKNVLDKEIGGEVVEVSKIGRDTRTPFPMKYMPGHPAADASGYVQMPNINTLIEMTDAREAQRSYEANLGMFTQSRDMSQRLIDMLR
jgi:flagellar basal-body rod protein FlgC